MHCHRSGHHRSLFYKLFNQESVSTTEAQHISVSDIHTSDDGSTLLASYSQMQMQNSYIPVW